MLGWEDAYAEAQQDPDGIGRAQNSSQTTKAKRQSKAVARNEKALPFFPIHVHGTRSVQKGSAFEKDTVPLTQKLVAATAEEAAHWANAINKATQSMAHDAMSLGLQTSNAQLSARAVKLLVIEGGTSEAAASGVSTPL